MDDKIGKALVVGAGISGIRASIDLAQMGYGVTLIDSAAHMGGILSQLDHQFPTNRCGMCRMLPMTDRDAGIQTCLRKGLFHEKIDIQLGTTLAAVEAMKIGAMDYLIKPFETDDLIPKVTSVYTTFQETAHLKRAVGAIVLATGTTCFDPSTGRNPMGYGIVPNVITGLELERMLSGSGPDNGRLLRPSDKRPVKKAVWIQCIGSRDLQSGADYCSTVCCMFALKEAALARTVADVDFQATVIYMDLRTFGQTFERYGQQIEAQEGVRLVRGRVHSIAPTPGSDDVSIRWTSGSGKIQDETFDLAVLSVGQRPGSGTIQLADALGIDTDGCGFVKTIPFSETVTRTPGIFAGGTLTGPTDIAESVVRAASAATNASRVIHRGGGGLSGTTRPPANDRRDVSREAPGILVMLCRCQGRSEPDTAVASLKERLKQDPAVERVMVMDAICTGDGWASAKQTDTTDVNRVLIGACRTFVYGRKTKALAEIFHLHPSLIEAVAVDDQQDLSAPATIATLMAGIARLKNVSVEEHYYIPNTNHALVVGGGIAGMHAALAVADHDVPVTLVEASERLGGNLAWLHRTIDGAAVAPFLEETVNRVNQHPGIDILMESRVVGAFGQAGHFFSSVETAGAPATTIEHGVVILATGGREAVTDAYGYGTSKAVVTQRELEQRIGDDRVHGETLSAVAMILCVGSREAPRTYCSRVCCPTALKQALWLKNRLPDLPVYILYRDMMTCGLSERWFTEARRKGILFFQYRPQEKPQVTISADEETPVRIRHHDPILDAPVEIVADLLVLATGIEAHLPEELAVAYGAAKDPDGFFLEADSKWRPVESTQAGVFACGIALAPRPIAESIATAEAAAGRALAVLNAGRQPVARTTATVRHSLCTQCLRCIDTCPYGARFVDETQQRVTVNPNLCQGCGDCATVCPNKASIVEGFSQRSLLAAIDGAMTAAHNHRVG